MTDSDPNVPTEVEPHIIATFGDATRASESLPGESAMAPPVRHMFTGVHMVELLREAVRGATGSLVLPVESTPRAVCLGARTTAPGRGYSGALAIVAQAQEGDFANLAWTVKMPATVWFGHPRGGYGFQSRIISGTVTELLLDLPVKLVRFARRRTERVDVAAGSGVAVLLQCTTDAWVRARRVVDLSVAGVGIVLEPSVSLPLHQHTRVTLVLGAAGAGGRGGQVTAIARTARVMDDGGVRYGMEFVDVPRALSLAIERHLASPAPR